MLGDIRTMKAAILVEQRRSLVVDEVVLPERLATGQVFVKVHCSGICGAQLGEIDGAKGPDRFLPHLLGHEAGATVLETGPGVRHVAAGDRVVMHWRKGAGIEAEPPVYRWGNRQLNAGWVTTFNEYAVASENRLTVVPNDFDFSLAALFGCPVTTGLGVVFNDAKLSVGESIVILGAGGVGLNVIQGAALVSAAPIVAVDRFDAKLELARRFGATHTINADGGDLEERIRQIVGSAGADVAVENTGNAGLIELSYRLSKPQGRTILVGVPRADEPVSIDTLPLHFGKVLTGSYGGGARPDADIPRYIGLYEAGRLKLHELVTDRFEFDRINEAIEHLRSGNVAGRCQITM